MSFDSKEWQKVARLQYVLLQGNEQTPALATQYDKAYQLWHSVWSDTLRDLDGAEKIFSDDFTRQDHVGALFEDDRCLMLSFFRRLNLNAPSARHDTYFKAWTPAALKALARDGADIIVGSNITLAPDVRGKNYFLPLKDLVLSLSVKYLLESGAHTMTGTTRNNRGMNAAALRTAATLLETDKLLHGVMVDLMAFYAKDIRQGPGYHLQGLTEHLWEKRLVSDEMSRVLKKVA